MNFKFKIILYLAKRIAILKKSFFLKIINIEYAKNIFLKILYFYIIIKLNDGINFDFSRYKIVMIIFEMIIWDKKCIISSDLIYYII